MIKIKLPLLYSLFFLFFTGCYSKERIKGIKAEKAVERINDFLNESNVNTGDPIKMNSDTVELVSTYFEKSGILIPDWVCSDFLKIEGYGDMIVEARSVEYRKLEGLNLFICSLKCLAGGVCKINELYAFSQEGNQLGSLTVSGEMGDAAFHNYSDYSFLSDSLVEIKKTKKEFSFNEESGTDSLVKDESFYEYHLISLDEGIIRLDNIKSDDREYPLTSYQVFTVNDLKAYSLEELDVMRNEIFASYGYRFKSKKWNDYFSAKNWYNARFDDVVDQLSLIDQLNVDHILEASKLK